MFRGAFGIRGNVLALGIEKKQGFSGCRIALVGYFFQQRDTSFHVFVYTFTFDQQPREIVASERMLGVGRAGKPGGCLGVIRHGVIVVRMDQPKLESGIGASEFGGLPIPPHRLLAVVIYAKAVTV